MKSVELSTSAWYGDKPINLEFPDHWEIRVVGDQELPALSLEEIHRHILSPIASQPLSDLASRHSRATILIDDLSRPTPTAELLRIILSELSKGGVPPDQITIVVAGGTHSPVTAEVIEKKVGKHLPPGIQLIAHDSHGNSTYLGKTKLGTPIYINPIMLSSDLKIGIGCIYPHPAAGFSGGSKILIPGVAGFQTIRYMHDHLVGAGERGGQLENEFRSEIEQIADRIGLDFIVNVTLNQQRQISRVFVGDRIQAFNRGVDYARQAYTVDLLTDSDITIADMYPFDADLQFAYDRGLWPLEFAVKDSTRIILASCPAGLGSHQLFPIRNSLWVKLIRRLRYFNLRDVKTLTYRFSAARKSMSRKFQPVHIISSGLNEAQIKSIFPSGKIYPDWPKARTDIEQKYLGCTVNVAIYRCAPLMLPNENAILQRSPKNIKSF
jgi:nickel-dependent lactate racemase